MQPNEADMTVFAENVKPPSTCPFCGQGGDICLSPAFWPGVADAILGDGPSLDDLYARIAENYGISEGNDCKSKIYTALIGPGRARP